MDTSPLIREVEVSDAAAMLALDKRLSSDTQYMLREPPEILSSVEEQVQIIQRILGSDDEVMLVSLLGSRLVGFVAATRRRFARVRHSFGVVIGIERGAWGLGIGHLLMAGIEQRVFQKGARRLELTVLENNERAVALYCRCGYALEGTRRGSMSIDGKLLNEYYMAKLV